MGIFGRGLRPPGEPRRYRIRITTEDGRVLYWHKGGSIHIVDEDVARIFLARFNPDLFEVHPDGSFGSPVPGVTARVRKLEMEEVR